MASNLIARDISWKKKNRLRRWTSLTEAFSCSALAPRFREQHCKHHRPSPTTHGHCQSCSLNPLLNISSASSRTRIFMRFTLKQQTNWIEKSETALDKTNNKGSTDESQELQLHHWHHLHSRARRQGTGRCCCRIMLSTSGCEYSNILPATHLLAMASNHSDGLQDLVRFDRKRET